MGASLVRGTQRPVGAQGPAEKHPSSRQWFIRRTLCPPSPHGPARLLTLPVNHTHHDGCISRLGHATTRRGTRSGGKTPVVAPMVHSPDLVPALAPRSARLLTLPVNPPTTMGASLVRGTQRPVGAPGPAEKHLPSRQWFIRRTLCPPPPRTRAAPHHNCLCFGTYIGRNLSESVRCHTPQPCPSLDPARRSRPPRLGMHLAA